MILVTGAAGYIGSHTCLELLRRGYDILGFDNYSNSSPEAVRRVCELASREFECITCDLLDKNGMREIFKNRKIDCVIHFAGLKAVGESCEIPLKYYENNVAGTVNLCQVMDEFDCRNMIFSSSATVYGAGTPPFSEDMPTGGCSNPYGSTKYMIEIILRDLCAADDRWSAVFLRYFNPVGADASGRIGEDPGGIPNNLMPNISQVAVGKQPSLRICGDDYDTPDGTGIRDYIHVTDLANGHVAAIKYATQHKGAEAINLGTGKGISVFGLLHAFEEACGKKLPFEVMPRRSGDVAESYADPSKAEKLLGFKATRGAKEICEDAWRWQSQNPNGYREQD